MEPRERKPRWPFGVLVLCGSVIFARSLGNSFLLDDTSQIVNNPAIHDLRNIPSLFSGSTFGGASVALAGVYYKPLMTSAYAVLYHWFGPNPSPFHLLQIVLHIANSLVVFAIFGAFFTQSLAWLMALLFLIHPINAESVVYVSALQDPLFFIFGSLALLTVMKAGRHRWSYFVFTVLMCLSLLSKETGALFLGITTLYVLLFSRDRFSAVLALSLGVLGAYLTLRYLAVGLPVSLDKPYPIMRLGLGWRLINIPAEVLYYLRNFVAPVDLSVGRQSVTTLVDLRTFYLPLLMIGILAAGAVSVGRSLWMKDTGAFRVFGFFALWFLIGLGLHVNIVPLDGTIADRWFYFPIVGLLGMVGAAVQTRAAWDRNRLVPILALLIVIVLSARTIDRIGDWKDGLTLAAHDINHARDSFPLENALAFELFKAGRFDEAEVHAKRSTELGPWWWLNWNNLGLVWRHRGVADPHYMKLASDAFQKAIDNTDHFYMPYENKAELLLFFEGPREAEQFIFESSLRIPPNVTLLLFLAIAEDRLGDRVNALEAVERALKLDPTNETAQQFHRALVSGKKIDVVRPSY